MRDSKTLIRLRIVPCGLFEPVSHTMTLVRLADSYRLNVVERNGISKKQRRWRVDLVASEVDSRLAALRQTTVPAFPVSPMVCDGEYIEMTVEGDYSTLALGWWTIAPEGAEVFAEFSDWIREAGLGNEDESENDES